MATLVRPSWANRRIDRIDEGDVFHDAWLVMRPYNPYHKDNKEQYEAWDKGFKTGRDDEKNSKETGNLYPIGANVNTRRAWQQGYDAGKKYAKAKNPASTIARSGLPMEGFSGDDLSQAGHSVVDKLIKIAFDNGYELSPVHTRKRGGFLGIGSRVDIAMDRRDEPDSPVPVYVLFKQPWNGFSRQRYDKTKTEMAAILGVEWETITYDTGDEGWAGCEMLDAMTPEGHVEVMIDPRGIGADQIHNRYAAISIAYYGPRDAPEATISSVDEAVDPGLETEETIVIPGLACWASYFINGDASGISDEEHEWADAWLDRNEVEVLDVERVRVHGEMECMDPYFSNNIRVHVPEADFDGGDLLDYVCRTIPRQNNLLEKTKVTEIKGDKRDLDHLNRATIYLDALTNKLAYPIKEYSVGLEGVSYDDEKRIDNNPCIWFFTDLLDIEESSVYLTFDVIGGENVKVVYWPSGGKRMVRYNGTDVAMAIEAVKEAILKEVELKHPGRVQKKVPVEGGRFKRGDKVRYLDKTYTVLSVEARGDAFWYDIGIGDLIIQNALSPARAVAETRNIMRQIDAILDEDIAVIAIGTILLAGMVYTAVDIFSGPYYVLRKLDGNKYRVVSGPHEVSLSASGLAKQLNSDEETDEYTSKSEGWCRKNTIVHDMRDNIG